MNPHKPKRKFEDEGDETGSGCNKRVKRSSESRSEFASQVVNNKGRKTNRWQLNDSQIIKPLVPLNERRVADLPRLGSVYHIPAEVRDITRPEDKEAHKEFLRSQIALMAQRHDHFAPGMAVAPQETINTFKEIRRQTFLQEMPQFSRSIPQESTDDPFRTSFKLLLPRFFFDNSHGNAPVFVTSNVNNKYLWFTGNNISRLLNLRLLPNMRFFEEILMTVETNREKEMQVKSVVEEKQSVKDQERRCSRMKYPY